MFKKKSLGQHFLKSASYIKAVADAAELTLGDTVLEIGPGDGALTTELLSRGVKVLAIEKDSRLIPPLSIQFEEAIRVGKLTLVEGDALEIDPPQGLYKVVANIPYYITGALLRKYLSAENQPKTLVFLIQKEVAERIARAKKESLLSLSIKAYGVPQYIKTVPRGAFSPPPKVDSAILRVSDISRGNFTSENHEKQFFELLHAGFAQKRKLLKSNIEPVLKEDIISCLEQAHIPQNARAEDVSKEMWLKLSSY